MSCADLTDPNAVGAALEEFDQLGRWTFLEKYGFGEARDCFVHGGLSTPICVGQYDPPHGDVV